MEAKIQELTDKIYREGVEKGEAEAKKLLSDAEAKAAAIVKEATAQAEKITADAKKQAAELKTKTESEIKLSGAQAVAAIKNQIVSLVTAKVINESATKTLSDAGTLKEFVSTVVSNWKAGGEAPKLEVLLPAAKQDELGKAFEAGASAALKVGFSKDIKGGFKIGPADGSFKISLTDADFQEFFKEYLRPRTRAYLFGE
ncbi:MAG: hypothetical protein FWC23_09665 [Chitinispirillia bacterium]|nr:hypothetical protein [Chitinispirillia bacterium]MCL2269436.1 hypothetical protein [Chitinispirillia bacterium]